MATRIKIEDWIEGDNRILLEGWARDGLTNEQIAKNIGISQDTLYEWKKKNSEFSDILKKDRAYCDYQVENALFKSAMEGNTTAQIFWLKNRKRQVWRDKPEEVSEDKEIKVTITNADYAD